MMNELRKPFHEELRMCLLEGTERLLSRKAALGEKVVYAHPDHSYGDDGGRRAPVVSG